ncbi:chromosome partition protein Smc [Ferrovum myxofaciens]|uniref:Chromosome partition protein Smc n=1 Tax=Ferrovum myxofaciens TaxID=416213 RepID=A0A149VWI0_9PROT|nr:anti-phage ZorAB system protein ZorA [Ferrovum myxofaciens]KXW57569.1 chromosome partition protein Smc [Ferrovum myxofaciens]
MNVTAIVLPYLPLAVGIVLLIATGFFLKQFFLPSKRLHQELSVAIRKLTEIKQRLGEKSIVEIDEIYDVMITDELKHLWSEYAETLHPQKKLDEFGQIKIGRYRATAMAEVFFSEQALVETPLRTAFYKHLPGILTGLGIIGTFSGLIYGLNSFHVTDNPNAVRASLGTLIQGVGHAFIISAIAIGLAMLCTWLTNRELTLRYRQVEKLCQLIDSFFDAGAGEEYLSRLVEASETSATQSIQLKDALVTDLREILTELTERQIREMSSGIGQTFADSMREPMERISRAVEGVSANQGDAVNRMLTDVLSNFSTRMEEMFGGQLHGMNDLLTKTAQSMQATADRFDKLSDNMNTAGQNAAEAMADRLNHAITSMEAHQSVLNKQMGEFVEQIRESISQSQSESSQKLQETLSMLGEQVAGVIGQIQDQAKKNSDTQNDTVNNLSGQVESLISQLVKTSSDLQTSISALTSATTSSIERMNSGAEMLAIAADDFAKAGQGVAGTMNASAEATGKIQSSSQTLSTATTSVQQMFADYRRTSDALAAMLADLKTTMETAKKEAGLTTQLVGQLKAAADQLGQAQQQADTYLQSINKVLTETHQSFANEISNTLKKGNSQFQQELSQAVGLLRSGIQELGDTLDDLPGRKG